MLFRKKYGIDLGSDTIKISDKKKKKILCAKNMIAIRDKTNVIAIGNLAYEMYEKTPLCVNALSPMKSGSLADGEQLGRILSRHLKTFSNLFTKKPNILITVPMELSEIEMRAFYKVLAGLPVHKIALAEKGIADAVGIGLPVLAQNGNLIVNIGAATAGISVVSEGKVILGRQCTLGGDHMDESIIVMVRRKHNLSIGKKTAKMLRETIGGCRTEDADGAQQIYGIHTISGLPDSVWVPSKDVCTAMLESIDGIADAILLTLQRTPPQLLENIRQNGIYLTGGVSLTTDIVPYLQDKISMPVYTVKDPIYNTMHGLVAMMNDKELKKLTFSLKDYVGNLI